MKNPKAKGSAFEREVCKKLSLWISKGANADVFWRSAMSGGRATVAKGTVRQAGDITAVAPEGHVLTDRFYIECKHRRDLSLDSLVSCSGMLYSIWKHVQIDAEKYGKCPMLIFRHNNRPTMLIVREKDVKFEGYAVLRWGNILLFRLDDFLRFVPAIWLAKP